MNSVEGDLDNIAARAVQPSVDMAGRGKHGGNWDKEELVDELLKSINHTAEISNREAMNASEHKPTDAIELDTPATPTEEIVGKELIAYQVASDGNWFRMSFSRANGKLGSLRLPTECLQALIMTLPKMMT